jgi:hypothetical protein
MSIEPAPHVLVLAAGSGSRFGSPKQLVRIGGEALLQRAVSRATAIAGHAVTVVLGAHAGELTPMLWHSSATVLINRHWQEGLASSIMPGKVNPVIPEAVNQVAYQIMGHDLAICMAAEAGQLQLNAMEPLIAYNILEQMRLLKRAMQMFEEKCIVGISANEAHCASLVHNSIGIVTALNPHIGCENATRIAKRALQENRSVVELVEEEGLMAPDQLREVLRPERMIASV